MHLVDRSKADLVMTADTSVQTSPTELCICLEIGYTSYCFSTDAPAPHIKEYRMRKKICSAHWVLRPKPARKGTYKCLCASQVNMQRVSAAVKVHYTILSSMAVMTICNLGLTDVLVDAL